MTQSKITVPLLLGIVGTIVFDLSPIALGYERMMDGFFLLFAAIMLALSFADRRVLGYATVLSVCNPANNMAYLTYTVPLALLTIVMELPALWRVFLELGKRRWWLLFLLAFIIAALSNPLWASDWRSTVTVIKHTVSRLGFLTLFPLAVGLTLRTPRDGVGAVSLLCLTSTAFLAVFYFRGQAGAVNVDALYGQSVGIQQFIGEISLGFNRTSVCIILAALASAALALGIGTGFHLRSAFFYFALALCSYMIMRLGSVGSAIAMVCGMVAVALGYFGARVTFGRLLMGTIFFSLVGVALYWSVFETENYLSKRFEEKIKQIDTRGIDRMERWQEGFAIIGENPIGQGWTSERGHSDWLLYFISFGWIPGFLYILSAVLLFASIARTLLSRVAADRQISMLLLVGLAGMTVYSVNSVFDMLSADIGYFTTVWALILTSVTVATVVDGSASSKKTAASYSPSSSSGKSAGAAAKMPPNMGMARKHH